MIDGRPLSEATRGQCRWPIGDPRDRSPRVCGAPVARPGLPYCPDHMLRGYGGSNEKVEIEEAAPSALTKSARYSLHNSHGRSVKLGTWLDPMTVEIEEDEQWPEDESNEQEEANNEQDHEDKPKKPRKPPASRTKWHTQRLIATTNENPFTGKRMQAFQFIIDAGPRGMHYNDWLVCIDGITIHPLPMLREMLKHIELVEAE